MSWLAFHGPLGQGGWVFFAIYALAYAGMLGIWKWLPSRGGTAWVIFLAASARVIMLYFPASDDIFRYLWEGHVQLYGFNPFHMAPAHPALEPYRTWYWDRIDHRGLATIYLPFSQLLFRAVAFTGETPLMLKGVVTVFDLGTLALLFGLVRRLGIPRRHLVLYALNPLVILFTSGEGHIESVFVFWVIAAAYCAVAKRPAFAFAALGLAVMTNAKAIFLAPFFIDRSTLKFLPIFLLPFLFATPFLDQGVSFLDMPFRFATHFHFNGLVFSLVSPPSVSADGIVPAQFSHWAYLLCGILFAAGWLAAFFLTPDPVRAMFHSAGAFIVCSPTLHPWYLLILAPALVLYRTLPWNILMLTVGAVFPVYDHYAATSSWRESPVFLIVEYGPFLFGWIWYFYKQPGGSRRELFPLRRSITIIIPTLNECDNIALCIESARQRQGIVPEIIVVDGGSRDGTPDRVARLGNVRLLESEPGRGIQIARGAIVASGDIILILHADSRLSPGSLARMLDALESRPDAAGGAFGASYIPEMALSGEPGASSIYPGLRLRFIANLNNFRARFLGIAFGDQAQFFRNGSLPGGFPALRLMEDVELSLRIKEAGDLLFLPEGVKSSARRWSKRGFLGNSFRVIGLVGLYLFRRRLGLHHGDGAGYYRKYYGNEESIQRGISS